MRIRLLDAVLETDDLDVRRIYHVIRTETVRDDMYYIVINKEGKETAVHELLAKEID